jgi:branched-chain amino acid aminotransferase
MIYYMDGEFVPAEEAMIPALDFSCLYGDGCFDSLSVADGVALDLEWRVDRLFNSARLMRISVPVSKQRLAELLLETARTARAGPACSGSSPTSFPTTATTARFEP